jgi:hypothetical protein
VILLFNPKANLSGFSEVRSEEDLSQFMSAFSFGPITIEACLSLVRSCRGYEDVGRKLFEETGADAELQKWNEALSLAEERTIRNDDANNQFKDHLRTAGMPLRAILRYHLQNNPDSLSFPDLLAQLDSLACPSEFETRFWDVSFGAFMHEVAMLFMGWAISAEVLNSIEFASSPQELIENLIRLELEPEKDPLTLYAENQIRCRQLLEKVQPVAIAWCLKNDIQPLGWDVPTDVLMSKIDPELKKVGYLEDLNDAQYFQLFRGLLQHELQKVLWEKLGAMSSFEDLQHSLGLAEIDVGKAQENLDLYKERLNRQKRLVPVCGKDFDCSEENLSRLWEHIASEIGDLDLPNIDIKSLVDLEEMPRGRRLGEKERPPQPPKKPPGRPSQAKKDLIGLAGEIHAYRVFQKTFGLSVINPSVWISSNSATVFPGNLVDDGFGCDFVFENEGKKYHVEVKATEGDDEAFELGSTEIRHAVEVANMKKLKFVILHVTRALSTKPDFRLLPNPYDSKSQKLYRIEEAGLRIRYRCIQANEEHQQTLIVQRA